MSTMAPDTSSAPATNGTTLKDSVVNSAAAAVNTVKDHPITQNLANGPVATSVKNQTAATSNELSGLANSRTTPAYSAANDTKLTHYHSFFFTLLSWKHPRATGITFASSVLFIFACRYLPILPWTFKMIYMILGVVALAEVASKFIMGSGVATSVRPRRYYTIPKESLEASLDDLEQLINFFVIEFQRILFAENVPVTIAAFAAAFLSYYLIKVVPFWGMCLISTSVIYLGPLIYLENQELIDHHIKHASDVIQTQATQVKDLTAEHTSKGFESVKAYTGDYAAKASELVGTARQRMPASVGGTSQQVHENDFPAAPQADFTSPASADISKPIVHAPATGEPIAASST